MKPRGLLHYLPLFYTQQNTKLASPLSNPFFLTCQKQKQKKKKKKERERSRTTVSSISP
jgi:hypothetical protein